MIPHKTIPAVHKRKLSEQKVLWSQNGWVMHSQQTAVLSEKVSAQKNGIVLCWTGFIPETNTVETYDNHYFFIPKEHVLSRDWAGVDMVLASQGMDKICCKYVYVSDTNVSGHDRNSTSGTGSGINWNSRYWVLRKILGV